MTKAPPPPRPSGSPLFHTLRFRDDPFSLIEDARAECGDIFSIRLLGLGDWTFLCSPELLRQFYNAPPDVLVAGEVNRETLGFVLGKDSAFCLDGKAHRERQRLVMPNLAGKRVLRHVAMMRQTAEAAIAAWRPDEPFALLERAHHLALEILMKLMLGVRDSERAHRLVELFDEFAVRGARSPLIMMPLLRVNLGPWSPWGRILALRQAVVGAFSQEVDRYLSPAIEGADDDFIACLLRDSKRAGVPISRAALVDEAINLIFAGHETTSLGFTWTMERLLSNPDVLERVRAEIEEVTKGEPLEAEHVGRLEYLQAVLQETLRWRPLAPMASLRRVKKPFEIGGYALAPGQVVTQAFSAMCRRPETFPEPDRFDPDRFYGRRAERYQWQPFGGGRHICIGKGLAEVELPVLLASAVRHAELRLVPEKVEAQRAGFFFAPSNGLRVVLKRHLRGGSHKSARAA